MTLATKPDKLAVRAFMQQRQAERKPLPTPEEIRRQLGWNLITVDKAAECAR